jgi:uncharacterized Tic20 family protein
MYKKVYWHFDWHYTKSMDSLGITGILKTINYPIHECVVSLHCRKSFLLSLLSVLCSSEYILHIPLLGLFIDILVLFQVALPLIFVFQIFIAST